MKANELMIGDWVMVKHTHREPSAERIEGVGRDVVLIKTESGMQSFGYDKLTPIPITPEILEANGFYKIPDYENPFDEFADIVGYDWRVNDYDYPLQLYTALKGNKICKVFGVRIFYVHELQHALRLRGLGENADNFKVK